MIASTPQPPYYAVIFTSCLSDATQGYDLVAEQMVSLAQHQSGFLGLESPRWNASTHCKKLTDSLAYRD